MGSKKSRGSEASARLRKRLSQIRACEKSGETLKRYAARQGISVHALYQAKKQARQKGLLPAHGTQKTRVVGSKRPKVTRRPRFVEAIAAPPASTPGLAWRLRLRSGDVLESNTPLSDHETLRLIHALRDRS
jgi:transposase-like protein